MALIPVHGKKGLADQFWIVSVAFRVPFVIVNLLVLIGEDSNDGLFEWLFRSPLAGYDP